MSGKSHGHGRQHGQHEEHEEHVNHEAWVIPYADILTLLMALFLVLWAISVNPNPDPAKAAEVAEAVEGAGTGGKLEIPEGGGVIEEGGADGDTASIRPNIRQASPEQIQEALDEQAARGEAVAVEQITFDQLEQELREGLAGTGLEDAVTIRRDERGLYVTIVTDAALFGSGSADVGLSGQDLLNRIAGPLKTLTNPIVIEGHTDSVPISTGRYPSNWELSTARATNVLRYLVSQTGFPAERISAAGYADTKPAASNSTAEGRARNRRVDIVVLSVARTVPTDQIADDGTILSEEEAAAKRAEEASVDLSGAADPDLPEPTSTTSD